MGGENRLEFLRRRATSFHNVALSLHEKKEYALSAFSSEQAVQLVLKHLIGTKLGDYPKTHSLKLLFQECVKICPAIKSFYETNVNIVGEIEDAYIMARYYDTEYEEFEIKNMLNFYDKLLEEIKLCG